MLVGDLVMDIREAVTDLPATLPTPSLVSLTAVQVSNGAIPPGTYFCVMTSFTPWGESQPSNELQITIANPNNAIQVAWSNPFGGSGAINKVRLYLGPAASEQVNYSDVAPSLPFTVVSLLAMNNLLPTRNTAYLPDTDGDGISSSTLFRWLNRGLELASQVAGGLLDYAGVGTISGVPQYVIPGEWKRISSLWYDGYPLAFDDVMNYFRRNTITASILASVGPAVFTDRMIIEVYPQPSRTAAQTTLAAPFAIGDTQAVLASAGGFLLTNGYAQIGGPGGEIVSYSGTAGNTLRNLVRGLGGTVAAAVAAGQPVNELNIFWNGWRMYAPNFQPGDSQKVLPIPVGWGSLLFKYGLGRAKMVEQGIQEAQSLEDDFIKKMSDWYRTNKQHMRLQVGEQSNNLETMPNMGGGWVIP